MTSYLQAIAEAIRKWEYAEDCILSLILIGTNDEVGCRRIIDYWIRDGRHLVMGHTKKLRYCADDIADLLPVAGIVEVLVTRSPVENPALSFWWVSNTGVKGHAVVTPPAAAAGATPKGVEA
ncbi:MAG: hypothetical protein WC343_02990 [Bacilli bacterium]|jgi:hypothetical protein